VRLLGCHHHRRNKIREPAELAVVKMGRSVRVLPTSKRDNDRFVMRLELSAGDVETLELLVERLDALTVIEDALGVVAVQSPSILGSDLPTVTREGIALISSIVDGWDIPAHDDARASSPESEGGSW
jgi:hypothetical protein